MIAKDISRNRLRKKLEVETNHIYASGVIDAFFGQGDQFENAMLACVEDGRDYVATNDSSAYFPNELAIEYGQPEDQYGYIEFENPAGMDRVPFDEAFRLIEIAAKHYIDYRPERREAVEAKLREGRKTFDRLIARHEAWKKAHPEA